MSNQESTRYRVMETPIGPVRVAWCDQGVVAIETGRQLEKPAPRTWTHDPELECPATEQLREYFVGHRREFDMPLSLEGTPFRDSYRAAGKEDGPKLNLNDAVSAYGSRGYPGKSDAALLRSHLDKVLEVI